MGISSRGRCLCSTDKDYRKLVSILGHCVNSISGLAYDFDYGLALDFCLDQCALLYRLTNLLLLYSVHPTFYFCTVCTVSAISSGIFKNVPCYVYSFIM